MYRQLGRTNLNVSLLGLGSGGANRLGQSRDADRSETHRLVRHALDLGINVFDTAPSYGDSESLLGEALVGVPRQSYVLGTKFTTRSSTPGAARASLEASLRRLKTDYVDVIYFHGLAPEDYDLTLEKFLPELHQAQRDGLTRFIGATERYETDDGHEALERALREDLFDVIMLGHNLISPGGLRTVLPLAEEHNVGVVVMCAVRTIIVNPDMLRETIRQWKDAGGAPRGRGSRRRTTGLGAGARRRVHRRRGLSLRGRTLSRLHGAHGHSQSGAPGRQRTLGPCAASARGDQRALA